MNFEMISPAEVKGLIHHSEILIIDLRSFDDYVKGHIEGAVNIPFEKLKESIMLPMDVQLIFYCEKGATSLRAAKIMADRGYLVKSMGGGYQAYQELNILRQCSYHFA